MKSQSLKKLASGLMSIVMAVGLMPLPAFAATSDTSDNTSGFVAATGLLGATSESQTYVEDKKVGEPVPGDVLDGVKIRFRPAGSHKPVSINDDGNSGQNVAHLYYNGKSSQFQLQKASDDSYYFYFYQHYKNAEPKTTDNCLLDVERTKNDESYLKEGQVIHITGKGTATNKQWRLIPQLDGTYYIQNVRSGLYMSLEDLSKPKTNDNKLIQRVAPFKWQIEIVSGTNAKLKSIKQYDSYNFTYKGATVNSTNWMGALPGTLKITDISIPGTHDAGTCYVHKDQGSNSDQRYYIDEILNAGVRHLDLRTGLNGDTVRIIHSGSHCLNRDGSELTMYQVLGWIDDFLNANPSETIVLQVKMDKDGTACERKTYAILEERAKQTDGKIWAGDHVPTLDEVRGKIVVISRLDPDSLQTNTPFQLDDGRLWGLECHDWKDSKDRATALTASGSNYEVWTQDNWNHDASGKKPYVKAALLGNTDDAYTNSTLARYEQAKQVCKDAWVFNYTSCSDGPATPFENSKEIHQWLYDRSDYNSNDRLVCSDTFTGVMAFDFVDALMAKHVYQTNFNRQYVTVHGINRGGNEVADIDPLTVYVGENEDAAYKLLDRDAMKKAIKAHFNVNGYLMKTADAGFMTSEKVVDEGDFESSVAQLNTAMRTGDVPSDLYVHLEAKEPCDDEDHLWDAGTITTAPTCKDKGARTRTCEKCGSTKTEDVDVDPTAHVTYTREMADDTATCEEGGVQTQHEVCSVCKEVVRTRVVETEPLGHSWGEPTYTWSNDKSTVTASHLCTRCNAGESETVATTNRVLEESGCESAGSIVYNADFDNESFDMQETAAESPAIGHSWGAPTYEWSSDDATVTATRACEHDVTHTQSETAQSAYTVVEAATCTEQGRAVYTATFENGAFAKQEKSAASIPATGHDWGEPTYTWAADYSSVTAKRVCKSDKSHVESETAKTTSKVAKAATCAAKGETTYTATFKNAAFAKQSKTVADIPTSNHSWGAPTYIWSDDNSSVVAVHTCENSAMHAEFEVASTTSKVSKKATCTEDGKTTYTATFKNAAFAKQSKTIADIPATGHSWGKPVYTWSEYYSQVTATRVCENDGSHVESETVQTTSTVKKAATCTAKGKTTYTAVFENAAFTKRTKTVADIPALGHNWGEPTYTWSEDYSQVTATRACGNNKKHVESETVESTSKVTKNATATAFGSCTYTAKFKAGWAKKQTKKVKLPKLAPDPAPVTLAKFVAKGKTKLKLSWNKVAGVERYVVYFTPCNTKGKTYKLKKVATLDAGTRSYAVSALKASTVYRARVVAQAKVSGKWKTLSKSQVAHAVTGNKTGKYTNATALALSSTYLALKQGETATLGGLVEKAVEGENMTAAVHTELFRFTTSNESVATVTAKGEVTANLPGTCKIYAQTSNGLWKSCKVVVK